MGGGRVISTLVYIHRTENGLRRSPKTCREKQDATTDMTVKTDMDDSNRFAPSFSAKALG